MDIKQLECFVSVAKTLNFSQTAQQLYLSQPAVTGQIKSLENE
ncbi:LysR family transcriptional regulator [[Clostridium] spiroforme]|nr:LysR family transcriptional regulator [Thomasclavelia spiroformis]MBM6879389.1 LysR family transcriptional regulator [Thomasclavelia spiroformis]